MFPDPFDASGAFETCSVQAGRVVDLDAHLERLNSSLKTLGILTWERQAVTRALSESARTVKTGYVRVAVRRTGIPRWILYPHPGVPYTPEQIRSGAVIRTVATRWPMGDPAVTLAKISERLGSILGRLEGGGADEILRLSPDGYLTEGIVSNLFYVKDGRLVTPPCWLGVLAGVTRTRIVEAVADLKIPVDEIPFNRHDLFNAQEAFLTNVLMGTFPIREVDGRRIGEQIPGPVTKQLMKIFEKKGKG